MKRAITITEAGADNTTRKSDRRNKEVIFKNCAPFIDCVSKINNILTDNTGCCYTDVECNRIY